MGSNIVNRWKWIMIVFFFLLFLLSFVLLFRYKIMKIVVDYNNYHIPPYNKDEIILYNKEHEWLYNGEYNKDFCLENCTYFLNDDWSRENNPKTNLEKCDIRGDHSMIIGGYENKFKHNKDICENNCNICAGVTCVTESIGWEDYYEKFVYTCETLDGFEFTREFHKAYFN